VRDECDVNESGAVGRQDVGGHDLLSLLIKANIAADMPESMRMSDSEILSRELIVYCLSIRSHDNDIHPRGTYIPACRPRNFEVRPIPVHTHSYL
jgi:hypothetical protein